MTDEALDIDPVTESIVTEEQQSNEVLLKPAQVRHLLKREREKVAAKLKSEFEQQQPRQTFNEEQMYENFAKRMSEEQRQAEAKRVEAEREKQAQNFVNGFFSKLDAAKSSRDDFESTISDFNIGAYHLVAVHADQEANTADIIYHLAKHPTKAVNLQILAERDPHGARKKIKELAQELQKIESEKQNVKKASEPLNRYTSANAGTKSGSTSMQEAKRKFKF